LRVKIVQSQTVGTTHQGIFRSKTVPRFAANCHIEFSDEEIEKIKSRKLGNLIVATFLARETAWQGDVDDVLGPIDRIYTIDYIIKYGWLSKDFASPGEAQHWEELLRERILPNLKQAILGEDKKTTFEL
jgi:hypothetical protein